MRPAPPSPPPTMHDVIQRETPYIVQNYKVPYVYFCLLESMKVHYGIDHKIKRIYDIGRYRKFFIEDPKFSAEIERAYLTEFSNGKSVVIALMSKATLLYQDRSVELRLHWDKTEKENTEWVDPNGSLTVSPDSTLASKHMKVVPAVHAWFLDGKMPWFNKVKKVVPEVHDAMDHIATTFSSDLRSAHGLIARSEYSMRFGKYFNGYTQAEENVIDPDYVSLSDNSFVPDHVCLNPSQFMLYTKRLGEQPLMKKYISYAAFMFASSFDDNKTLDTPMSINVVNKNFFFDAAVQLGRYNPNAWVLSYEEFQKRCDTIDEKSNDEDDTDIKNFVTLIRMKGDSLGKHRLVNPFSDFCIK